MRPRVFISIFLVILGLIVAIKPAPRYNSLELTAEELLNEASKEGNYISVDDLVHKLINEDPSVQLVDLRDKVQFESFHLPGSINIPFEKLFEGDNVYYLNQDVKQNIFYSNGTTVSNKAWLLTKVEGFENNYILEGGLNEWFSKIILAKDPGYEASAEEQERYSYRSAAKNYFTGGGLAPVVGGDTKKKAATKPKPKKKKPAGGGGGCG